MCPYQLNIANCTGFGGFGKGRKKYYLFLVKYYVSDHLLTSQDYH
jgi:hypothetical protein